MIQPEIVAIPFFFIVGGWGFRTWLVHNEKMAVIKASKQEPAQLDARLQRVEQAVESIAIEMERVGEGQRFVTKLLNDRAQQRSDPSPILPRKINTPH